jgi:hypothetical protein
MVRRYVLTLCLVGLVGCLTKHNPAHAETEGSTSTATGSTSTLPTTTATGSTTQGPGSTTASSSGDGSGSASTGGSGCADRPGGVCFDGMPTFDPGGTVGDLEMADIDGDGNLDVVVGRQSAAELVPMLGNGTGALTNQTPVTVADSMLALEVADIDGDGILDLVGCIGHSNMLVSPGMAIAYGLGDGTFGAAVTVMGGTRIYACTSGDIDGDGDIDMALGDRDTNDVTVYLQDAGSFTPQTPLPSVNTPNSMATGDIDGDGFLDIAAAPSNNAVRVFFGDGTGGARESVQLDGNVAHYGVALADLDADGALDLATTRSNSSGVAILFNTGDGTFEPSELFSSLSSPREVEAGDVNGDGILDLVVAEYADNEATAYSLLVLVGRGNRGFDSTRVDLPDGLRPSRLELGDLNNDGLDDIAVSTGFSLTLVLTAP